MPTHSEVIRDNLSSLCDKTNISQRLLDNCTEVGILTRDESAEIEQYSGYKRNRGFYESIRRKDSDAFNKLVHIMESRDTLQSNDVLLILNSCEANVTCSEPKPKRSKVSGNIHKQDDANSSTKRKTLNSKWWPEERNWNLVNAFHERKIKEKLFVEELHDMLTRNPNGMAVISQKVAVSGLGGVGKTTTAKWYANHYKKFYDHIIWLDCGEGSLLKSFQDLARELDIKNRHELDLTKLAKESFSALEKFKCLCIFDNAECYTGKEGVRDVLPKNENFNSIITSRNREWGNETGLGTISQFQLDVFDIEESTTFMKKNLHQKSFHDDDLKQLCQLLGNLPLALQIATAALNRQKINLGDYIERVETTDHIISRNFDDYERTINATLKISLDIIKHNENDPKQLAYRILLIFGYIQPDNVDIIFFERVEESTIWEVQEAMDLLEMYSLISKRQKLSDRYSDDEVVTFDYSIHRLLQQVTRHNGRDTERDTIRKILNCEDFLNYKLIPFSLADEQLKSEFSTIRVQLIDQLELTQLIKERKFTDATQLSEIIKNTIKSSASEFNYAICLKNRRKFKASLEMFNQIYISVTHLDTDQELKQYSHNTTLTEILDLNYEPTKSIVGSQLFIIHLLENRFKMADKILRREKTMSVVNSEESLICILEALRTSNIIKVPTLYRLVVDENVIHITLLNVVKREIIFEYCLVDITSGLPEHLDRLELRGINLKAQNNCLQEKSKLVDFSDCIPSSVIDLYIDLNTAHGYYVNDRKILACNGMVALDKLVSIEKIQLMYCKIKLSDKESKISPIDLDFENVSFVRDGTEAEGVTFFNELINFHRVKNILITANTITTAIHEKNHEVQEVNSDVISTINKLPTKMCVPKIAIEMIGSCNLDTVVLKGNQITILNWDNANWNINRLCLSQVPFEKSQLNLKLLEIEKSSIKLSSLPVMIETLILSYGTQVINEKEDFLLPELKYLCVKFSNPSLVEFPFLLKVCRTIKGLKVVTNAEDKEIDDEDDEDDEEIDDEDIDEDGEEDDVDGEEDYVDGEEDDVDGEEDDVDGEEDDEDTDSLKIDANIISTCASINTLKLEGVEVVGEGVRQIDKLILVGYDFKEIDQILNKIRARHLVITNGLNQRTDKQALLSLIQKPFESITVGSIFWQNFEKSPLANYVDSEGMYYRFENQKGRVITEDEYFDSLRFSGEDIHEFSKVKSE